MFRVVIVPYLQDTPYLRTLGPLSKSKCDETFQICANKNTNSSEKLIAMATEESVGIIQYTHPELAGTSGILKQRYSDFVVREVTLSGEVVELKSVDGDELQQKWFGKDKANKEESCIDEGEDISELLQKEISVQCAEIADETTWQSFRNFVTASKNKTPDCPTEWIGFPSDNKAIRSHIHQTIKKYAKGWLDTTTIQQPPDTRSYIKLLPLHNMNSQDNSRKRKFDSIDEKKNRWPTKECGGDYLQFTLLKENIDTMQAVQVISKQLHMKTSDSIYYNGTKDKRGITTQKVTIYRRKPSEFKRFLTFYKPLLRIGDFKYVATPDKLGALAGNRFEIILRDIKYTSDESVRVLCDALARDGFLNYFGLQRFGKGGTKSHELGAFIFQSNWKACIESLFTANEHDKPELKLAKEYFQSKDYSKAYQTLPYNLYAERNVLRSLLHAPEDYASAFQSVNKFMRLLCAHAYQSFVWNHAVSKRIAKYGLQVIEGDLVYLSEEGEEGGLLEEVLDESMITEEPAVSAAAVADEGKEKEKTKCKIHIITKDDLIQQTYSLKDIVLPLIGYESILPANEIAEVYHTCLANANLTLSHFATCLSMYQMKGTYRKVFAYPKQLTWKQISYTNPNEELNDTELTQFRTIVTNQRDHKKMNGEEAVAVAVAEPVQHVQEKVQEEGKGLLLHALQLKFTLSAGTYATMLLREITKESTETEFQMNLTSSAAANNTNTNTTISSTTEEVKEE